MVNSLEYKVWIFTIYNRCIWSMYTDRIQTEYTALLSVFSVSTFVFSQIIIHFL